MDTTNEPRPGDEAFDGFRMRLPEDCVEYMLFIIGDKSLGKLEIVRKAAVEKANELTKEYIWQREPFRLETKIQKGELRSIRIGDITIYLMPDDQQGYRTFKEQRVMGTVSKTSG